MRNFAISAVVTLIAFGCGDTNVEVVSTSRLTATHDTAGPYVVWARVIGDPDEVVLHYSRDRGVTFLEVEMDSEGDGTYRAEIPGTGRPGVHLEYFVAAGDGRDPASKNAVFSFEVLPEDGPCVVDSDCVAGEICIGDPGDGTCRVAGVTCSESNQCAQGFACELDRSLCVVVRRACSAETGDAPCLTSEICDLTAASCVPRLACEMGMCPSGFVCDAARNACLRP